MPTPVTPPKPGRKSRDPIDVLRTRVWFHVVRLRSRLSSAYAIELAFEDRAADLDGVKRPGKWSAYADGSRVPQRMQGKTFAVDIAESRLPGTAAYFESPLWSVLKGAKPTAKALEESLRQLDFDVRSILFFQNAGNATREPRLADFDVDSARRLSRLGSFGALVAAVLLIARSEAIASTTLRDLAFASYLEMQPIVEQSEELGPFATEIFQAIDFRCKHWVFPTTQWRGDFVVSSRELRKVALRRGCDITEILAELRLFLCEILADGLRREGDPDGKVQYINVTIERPKS